MSDLEKFEKLFSGDHANVLTGPDNVLDVHGDLRELEDIDLLVKNCFIVLQTIKRTYLFDPEFGCALQKFVFEPSNEYTIHEVRREVEYALRNYVDKAKFTVDVKINNKVKKNIIVTVTLSYKEKTRKVRIMINEDFLKTVSPSVTE